MRVSCVQGPVNATRIIGLEGRIHVPSLPFAIVRHRTECTPELVFGDLGYFAILRHGGLPCAC